MKVIKYNFWICVLLTFFSGCSNHQKVNQNSVNFLVVNNSFSISVVDMDIYVDDMKIISDRFKSSDIVPNYEQYSFSMTEGKHSIRVEALNKGVTGETVIDVGDSLLSVFISFNYHVPDSAEIIAKKEIHELMYGKKRLFYPDSLIRNKEIIIFTKTGKTILL